MSDESPKITDKWEAVKHRFMEKLRLGNKPQDIENPGSFYAKLFVAKNKADYIRNLEIEGYRLAHDKKHGLAVVDRMGKAYSIEKALESANVSRLKLGDPSGLPSIAEAKANFEEHMIKVLPKHLEYRKISYRGLLSFYLNRIRSQRMYEQSGFGPAVVERISLVRSALWERREHYQQQACLKKDIQYYEVNLRQKTRQQQRAKGKGLGL